jgi:hypothetical protein
MNLQNTLSREAVIAALISALEVLSFVMKALDMILEMCISGILLVTQVTLEVLHTSVEV